MVLRVIGGIKDRLKAARERAGYATAADAARAFGWKEPTYTAHENGSRGVKARRAEAYSRAFRVRLPWLLTGDGSMTANTKVPVVGYIGAGETVLSIDDYPKGGGLDLVDRPPDAHDDGLVALRIRGDSMRPLRDGWIVFYSRHAEGVPADAINNLCVIRLRSGETYLKELRRGYTAGRFNLHSWSAAGAPIEDAEIEWAARVEHISCP